MRGATAGLALLILVQAGCATATAPTSPPGSTALSPDAQAQALLEVGQSHIARGEMAAALLPLREALRQKPDLLEARASLGVALLGVGDLEAAVEELRGLLRQHPDAIQARLTLATALVARQDWIAAQRELEDVVRRRPDLIQAHYSLGVVRYTRNDLPGAIEAYRQVLARTPAHHDARYNLALILKLAHREAEATPEFLAAAHAGHARAQLFTGIAYAEGLGVERDLAQAIGWWTRAAEQGVLQAEDALAELRQVARGRTRREPTERQAVERAFQDYRMTLGKDFPGLRPSGDDTVGAALLRDGRVSEAVPVLLREAAALSDPAERLLETLYEEGIDGRLAAYDARILRFFETAAGEGEPRARIALARFYAGGLGVTKDVERAVSLLQTTPHDDARRLLEELSVAVEGSPSPARP